MSSNKNKANDALKPKNQYSPFGTLANTDNGVKYTPKYLPGQKDILNNATSQAGSLLKNDIPSLQGSYKDTLGNYLGFANSLGPDNLVNPKTYQHTLGLLSAPILSQYQNDFNSLNNNLAAQNLLGGSYDALAHGQLEKNLGYNLGQAGNQSYLSGLDATNSLLNWMQNATATAGQGVANTDSLINNLQGLSQNTQNQTLAPFTQFSQYQSVLNPLQQQTANNIMQRGFWGTLGNNFAASLGQNLANPIGFIKGNPQGNPMGSGTNGNSAWHP